MNTLEGFSSFVMDLYDVYSGITVTASADNITIHVDKNQKILLWFDGDHIYPQIIHDFDTTNAIDFDTVLEILKVVDNYKKG